MISRVYARRFRCFSAAASRRRSRHASRRSPPPYRHHSLPQYFHFRRVLCFAFGIYDLLPRCLMLTPASGSRRLAAAEEASLIITWPRGRSCLYVMTCFIFIEVHIFMPGFRAAELLPRYSFDFDGLQGSSPSRYAPPQPRADRDIPHQQSDIYRARTMDTPAKLGAG